MNESRVLRQQTLVGQNATMRTKRNPIEPWQDVKVQMKNELTAGFL